MFSPALRKTGKKGPAQTESAAKVEARAKMEAKSKVKAKSDALKVSMAN